MKKKRKKDFVCYPPDQDSVLAMYEVDTKRIDPQNMDWIYCHLHLDDGREVFTMLHEREADVLLCMPIQLTVVESHSGKLKIDLNPFNPFSSDALTSIAKARVVTANNLSDRYRAIYKKALTDCFGYQDDGDEALIETDTQEKEDFISVVDLFQPSGKPN